MEVVVDNILLYTMEKLKQQTIYQNGNMKIIMSFIFDLDSFDLLNSTSCIIEYKPTFVQYRIARLFQPG